MYLRPEYVFTHIKIVNQAKFYTPGKRNWCPGCENVAGNQNLTAPRKKKPHVFLKPHKPLGLLQWTNLLWLSRYGCFTTVKSCAQEVGNISAGCCCLFFSQPVCWYLGMLQRSHPGKVSAGNAALWQPCFLADDSLPFGFLFGFFFVLFFYQTVTFRLLRTVQRAREWKSAALIPRQEPGVLCRLERSEPLPRDWERVNKPSKGD